MSYDTRAVGDAWEARCRDCHEVGHTDRLSELGGWMAAHKCPPPTRGTET